MIPHEWLVKGVCPRCDYRVNIAVPDPKTRAVLAQCPNCRRPIEPQRPRPPVR